MQPYAVVWGIDHMENSYEINKGLRIARQLLLDLVRMGKSSTRNTF